MGKYCSQRKKRLYGRFVSFFFGFGERRFLLNIFSSWLAITTHHWIILLAEPIIPLLPLNDFLGMRARERRGAEAPPVADEARRKRYEQRPRKHNSVSGAYCEGFFLLKESPSLAQIILFKTHPVWECGSCAGEWGRLFSRQESAEAFPDR